ncbi:hypothetical protein G7B11_29425, partial [Klebsiella pneumoniae]|nr:hypothetical protein [Klebsiella pneumoniae]
PPAAAGQGLAGAGSDTADPARRLWAGGSLTRRTSAGDLALLTRQLLRDKGWLALEVTLPTRRGDCGPADPLPGV